MFKPTLLFVECPATKELLDSICQRIPLLKVVTTEQEAKQLFGNTPIDMFIFDSGHFPEATLNFIERIHTLYENVSLTVLANETLSIQRELEYLEKGVYDVVRVPFVQPILEAKLTKVLILRKELNRLISLSSNDALTDVANRGHFNQVLELECDRAVRHRDTISLLMIDIDYFKKYNDKYGHLAGDEAIKAVAKILKASARRPSDLVARYGGEEFAVLLPRTDSEGVKVVSTNISVALAALGIEHTESLVSQHLTLSQGGVTAKYDKDLVFSPDLAVTLIKVADDALYEAKHQGRHRLVQTDYFYSKDSHTNKSSTDKNN